jgi:NhaP-type Na+/H+ or K+/H+ antiporter
VLLLLLLGGAVATGLLSALTWPAVAVGAMLLFVIRPVAAWSALLGGPARPAENHVIAFFGIRGIGTFYYIAYALSVAAFPDAQLVWATAALVVVSSVLIHGILATPVMQRLDHRRERQRTQTAEPAGAG